MTSYDWERSISFVLPGFQTLCSAKLADIELSLNGKCFFFCFVLFCFYFLIETTLSLKQISEFEMNLTLLFIIL